MFWPPIGGRREMTTWKHMHMLHYDAWTNVLLRQGPHGWGSMEAYQPGKHAHIWTIALRHHAKRLIIQRGDAGT
eukprot:5172032-Karenia_brevis.AAC.1